LLSCTLAASFDFIFILSVVITKSQTKCGIDFSTLRTKVPSDSPNVEKFSFVETFRLQFFRQYQWDLPLLLSTFDSFILHAVVVEPKFCFHILY
jgi:hypothetical protein